jgi:hypothetical protein
MRHLPPTASPREMPELSAQPRNAKDKAVPTGFTPRGEDLQSQLQGVLHEDGAKTLKVLMESPKASELIRAMPDEDFYFTVKQLGSDDAVSLLQKASPSQWQHILDLELWRKDRLSIPQIEKWLRTLLSCGWDCTHRWLLTVDADLLIGILQNEIRGYVREDALPRPPKDLDDLWTLDDIYYVEFLNPRMQDIIQAILRILCEEELNFYRRVMQQVVWGVKAQIEEQAYRFRSARLEDHGFLPQEEAISVYQYQPPQRLEDFRQCELSETTARIPEESTPPHLPWNLMRGEELIGQALQAISHPAQVQRIKLELASLGNQVLTADLTQIQGKETLLEVLGKIKSYLTLGLQCLGARDIQGAASWLIRLPLKTIFQIGFSAFLERGWRAQKIWREHWSKPLRFKKSVLGFPWTELLEGLEGKHPTIFVPESNQYRHPRSMVEINRLDSELDRMEAAGVLLQTILKGLEQVAWRGILVRSQRWERESVSWRIIFFTSFVNWFLRDSLAFSSLSMDDVRRFHASAWRRTRPRTLLRGPRKGWSSALIAMSPDRDRIFAALCNEILDDLEEAMKRVTPEGLDPRFLPLLVSRERGRKGPTS